MDEKPDYHALLMALSSQYGLSLRFNSYRDVIEIYYHIGTYEGDEQAYLSLIKYFEEMGDIGNEPGIEEDDG